MGPALNLRMTAENSEVFLGHYLRLWRLRVRPPIAFVSRRLVHLLENVQQPEARLNLALLRAEDGLIEGAATADDIFGAAPGAGSDCDARVGIAIILHGSFNDIVGGAATARNQWNRAESS